MKRFSLVMNGDFTQKLGFVDLTDEAVEMFEHEQDPLAVSRFVSFGSLYALDINRMPAPAPEPDPLTVVGHTFESLASGEEFEVIEYDVARDEVTIRGEHGWVGTAKVDTIKRLNR